MCDNIQLFHIHTFRCKHAGADTDKAYVEKAIDLGASHIWFTDHAPFPGNPFNNRMDMAELPEYIASLNVLRDKYKDYISVKTGLEIEYLPSFEGYYRQLKQLDDINILVLGQHFFEKTAGVYSFMDTPEEKSYEMYGLSNAITYGIQSGYFDVVAHPDRIFRKQKMWTRSMSILSERIILAAHDKRVILEKNLGSMKQQQNYWNEFWKMVPDTLWTTVGYDAHSVKELEESRYKNTLLIG